LPFGQRCTIFDAEGGTHMETFARDAFTIPYPHDIKLESQSQRPILDSVLDDVFHSTGGLDFIAKLPDSPQARALLARADEIRGVSIECTHEETQPDRALRSGDIVVSRAKWLAVRSPLVALPRGSTRTAT
jgi:hypothetical protein